MASKRLIYILALGVSIYLQACSSVTIDNDSPPEVQYAEGERLLKKERYMEAVERFRILKNRHPYSKYAAQATLKIADAHYEEESFIEAAASYKIFRDLYPKHEMAEYALFRMGESNVNQLPSTIDRDLDPASAAIDSFKELLEKYPNSTYKDQARNRIKELNAKLAEKEDYVGNFYFVRNQYNGAIARYRTILEKFSGLGHDEKALYRLAFSYEKIGDPVKAEETIERLNLEFPNGKFHKDAEQVLKQISKAKQ